MKQLITKSFFLGFTLSLAYLGLAQQVPKNYVTLESSTGTWCGACPAVADIFHDMEAAGKKVAKIKYHNGDSYTTTDSDGRNNYYTVGWFPQAFIDGDSVGYDNWADVPTFNSMYDAAIAEMSDFTIDLNASLSGSDVTVTGTVTQVSSNSSSNLRLQIVATENSIAENWQGQSELNNVARKSLPDFNGATLDFSSASTHDFNETFTLGTSWNVDNMEVIAFVQDHSTRKILQTVKIQLSQNVGIDENNTVDASVYPNPAKDKITIEADQLDRIELMDAAGRILSTTHSTSDMHTIDLSQLQLKGGMYFVKITTKDGRSGLEKVQVR